MSALRRHFAKGKERGKGFQPVPGKAGLKLVAAILEKGTGGRTRCGSGLPCWVWALSMSEAVEEPFWVWECGEGLKDAL